MGCYFERCQFSEEKGWPQNAAGLTPAGDKPANKHLHDINDVTFNF